MKGTKPDWVQIVLR